MIVKQWLIHHLFLILAFIAGVTVQVVILLFHTVL